MSKMSNILYVEYLNRKSQGISKKFKFYVKLYFFLGNKFVLPKTIRVNNFWKKFFECNIVYWNSMRLLNYEELQLFCK